MKSAVPLVSNPGSVKIKTLFTVYNKLKFDLHKVSLVHERRQSLCLRAGKNSLEVEVWVNNQGIVRLLCILAFNAVLEYS